MPRKRSIYDARWRKVRKFVLERDKGLCQIKGPNCTVVATEGDHILPPKDGGALYDPLNIRAACLPCNHGRHNRLRQRRSSPPSREW